MEKLNKRAEITLLFWLMKIIQPQRAYANLKNY